jgi:transposase
MRAGTEAALARVVTVFGAGAAAPCLPVRQPARQPHEGAGARRHRRVAGGAAAEQRQVRLAQGRGGTLTLTRAQFDALVLGLPWQRIGEAGVITLL